MKKLLFIAVIAAVLTSCGKTQDPFEWNKDRVGLITKDTKVYQLDSLFANDSIINPIKGDEFSNGAADIEVYEKGGKHLLSISPLQALDSTSTIANIRIHDDRYKTEKGITINSTFKEIAAAYKISNVDNMIDDAVVWVNDQNFYFTVSKDNLPVEVKYDMSATVEKTMIPDNEKPVHVFVSW